MLLILKWDLSFNSAFILFLWKVLEGKGNKNEIGPSWQSSNIGDQDMQDWISEAFVISQSHSCQSLFFFMRATVLISKGEYILQT